MRGDAPLTDKEWEQLDKVVVETARQFLVGRRFIELTGPLGSGAEVVPMGTGKGRTMVSLEPIEQDFTLFWQDIAANRKNGMSLDLGAAAQASMACAQAEDNMIFDALFEAGGPKVDLGNWDEQGTAFANVNAAIQALVEKGLFGPYAVIVSPALYAKTQRYGKGMRLESKLIADVAKGGLLQSPVLDAEQGLVVSLGAFNFDLVVGQDLTTAYMGNEALDHLFRVIETLALRIKRPESICTLEK
jgi:uncharacterized linocin/CFP29 family protein